MSNSATNNQGFTLVEAAVAIAVLTVGMWTVIQFFPYTIKIIGDSQNLTVASNLVVERLEILSSQSYDVLSVGAVEAKQPVSGDQNSYLSKYQRQTVIELVDSNLESTVTDIGLKKITVTVYWQSPIGSVEKSTNGATIIANH